MLKTVKSPMNLRDWTGGENDPVYAGFYRDKARRRALVGEKNAGGAQGLARSATRQPDCDNHKKNTLHAYMTHLPVRLLKRRTATTFDRGSTVVFACLLRKTFLSALINARYVTLVAGRK
jgi:hypothetical protein